MISPLVRLVRRMTRARRSTQVKGFVLVVVVLMMAVVTSIVFGQLAVVRDEAIVAVREEEEIQARALAEGCLGLLHAYVDEYMFPGTQTSPAFADFDKLLDTDNDLTTFDDKYLPPGIAGATRVVVPRNLTPATGTLTSSMHQWLFLPRPAPFAGGLTGGCLLRLEDNSDDGLNTVALPLGSTTAATEGPGTVIAGNPTPGSTQARDQPDQDRDRSIFLTAVGLYPVLGTADEAYEDAHARVTLRRLYGVNNPTVSTAALQACGNVTINNNSHICGLGGVQGANVTIGGGSECSCGPTVGGTVTPPAPEPACTSGCPVSPSCVTPPSVGIGAPPTCTPPAIPGANALMDNKNFGNPNSATNDIGDTATCKIYSDPNGVVYYWDSSETDVTSGTIGPALAAGGGCPAGTRCGTGSTSCATYTDGIGASAGKVESPCTWYTNDTVVGAANDRIVCAAGQTPCWKPMARLDNNDDDPGALDGSKCQSDMDLGPRRATPMAMGLIATGVFEMCVGGGQYSSDDKESLKPLADVPLPNARDINKVFGTPTGLHTTLCGDPAGCSNCNYGNGDELWEYTGGPPITEMKNDSAATQRISNDTMPVPLFLVVKLNGPTLSGGDIIKNLSQTAGGPGGPLHLSLITNSMVDFNGSWTSLCCATCDCSVMGASRSIAAASCVVGNAAVPPPPYVAPPPPAPPPPRGKSSGFGYAINTTADCFINGDNAIIGDVKCNAIQITGSNCFDGAVLATGSDNAVGCTGGQCGTAGLCIALDPVILYDIQSVGSVCGGGSNNADITANIFTSNNVDFKNNATIIGQVVAGGNINFDNNATIDFPSASNLINGGNPGVNSFCELQW